MAKIWNLGRLGERNWNRARMEGKTVLGDFFIFFFWKLAFFFARTPRRQDRKFDSWDRSSGNAFLRVNFGNGATNSIFENLWVLCRPTGALSTMAIFWGDILNAWCTNASDADVLRDSRHEQYQRYLFCIFIRAPRITRSMRFGEMLVRRLSSEVRALFIKKNALPRVG